MSDAWEINMEISVRANNNFDKLYNHIIKTLGSISLSNEDIETRKKMGKYPYIIVFNKQTGDYNGNNPEVNNVNKFILRTNDSRIILKNLFSKVLEESLANIRISMDAGKYSRDIEFSEFNSCITASGNPESNFENELNNILRSDRYTYITYSLSELKGLFAQSSASLIIRNYDGNALDLISNIKGFKIIK